MKHITILLSLSFSAFSLWGAKQPNIIIMFVDDQGYADLGCYGAKGYKTPHLDRMAEEGVRFTDFYVSSPVCSASRSSLMTGCYNERVGISGALGPKMTTGLSPEETTIAELCKSKGYATAIFGKWHLGRPQKFLPLQQGFDEYLGIPYSNDMWPYHPNVLHLPMKERLKKWPHLPLFEGNDVINPKVTPEDQKNFTTLFTERAVNFIERNKDKPFFLYVPHPQPHVPLFVSGKFEGKTERGTYGDVISEIDWSMGQILAKLKELKIDDNTLVIYSSDNGPWLSYGEHGGRTGKLREGKGTCWEGGIRVPCIMRWPGKIPSGKTVKEMASTIDIFPTIAKLIDAGLPEKKIDGLDIWPLISSKKGAKSPHSELFFYYKKNELQAMRSGNWKLILPHTYRTLGERQGGTDGLPVKYENLKSGLELYHLKKDISESKNVAEQNPEVVERLLNKVDKMRKELGDKLTNTPASNQRKAGSL